MLESIISAVNSRRNQHARLLQRRRRGATMLVIALSTIVIFGCAALAVDFGLLTNDKNKWQRGVDAAALAGAQELTDTAKARSIAKQVAAQNGITVADADITFLDNDTKIRVFAGNARRLYFARLLGIPIGNVDAVAIAAIIGGTPTETIPPAVVPIGITKETRDAYTLPTLNPNSIPLTIPRVVDEPYDLNKFVVFDLRQNNAKSPVAMQNQLINGWTETKIGDFNTSLNSSVNVVNNNFLPALAVRFQKAAETPWHDAWSGNVLSSTGIRYAEIAAGTARADNPRVMFLIVNNPATQAGGTTNHEVLAFQPVYVEAWQNDQLIVRFLPGTFTGTSPYIGDTTNKIVSLIQ